MAFFQIDLSDLFQQQDRRQFDQFVNNITQAKESIQQNLQSLLQFKFMKIIQDGDLLIDVTKKLQEILDYSNKLKDKFEQSQKLQQKLSGIEEEVLNYFECKQNFKDIISDYQTLFQQHLELKLKVKDIQQNDLPRIQAQQRLKEYASLTKQLADYATFENDLTELRSIDERFQILEQEEDYLQYYLLANNKNQNQTTISNIQLLSYFVQMLGQSIGHLKTHKNCSIILSCQDKTNISEEGLMQYKQAIILKTYDNVPALIFIDKEKSDAQVICAAQHRSQNKSYLENYKNYLGNIKISYALFQKQDKILDGIYTQIIEILIRLNIINQIRNLTYQEMLQTTQKILLYQQNLEELDYFQFLDSMQIELN